MPKVTVTATGRGTHTIEVFYGPKCGTKTLGQAFNEVKKTVVEMSKSGLNAGPILHYPNDHKNCQPVEIPFNTGALSL